MTDAKSVYKSAMVAVRATMKRDGFSAKAATFWRLTSEENTLLISLQKSVAATSAEMSFAVNYGVCSRRVRRRMEESGDVLDIWQAHWRKRLEVDGRERWILVGAADDVPGVVAKVLGAVALVVPDLLRHASDEALLQEWGAGRSPGLVGSTRLLFAAILADEFGLKDRVSALIDELRSVVAGRANEQMIEYELRRSGLVS